jgi:hypothetical protein
MTSNLLLSFSLPLDSEKSNTFQGDYKIGSLSIENPTKEEFADIY